MSKEINVEPLAHFLRKMINAIFELAKIFVSAIGLIALIASGIYIGYRHHSFSLAIELLAFITIPSIGLNLILNRETNYRAILMSSLVLSFCYIFGYDLNRYTLLISKLIE